jgi:transposase
MHVADHHSIEQLKRLIRKQNDARMLVRLQMVILAQEGQTAPQIAATLSVSRRMVQFWVHCYNTGGLEGLRDRRKGGNQRKLDDAQEQQIIDYLNQQAADPHGGVRRGEDLRRWIRSQFGVLYSLPGTYDLLHRLGYSCLMPRPRHKNTDPETQAAFKKTPRHKSRRLPINTRANRSKSGSRTKLGLANKAR